MAFILCESMEAAQHIINTWHGEYFLGNEKPIQVRLKDRDNSKMQRLSTPYEPGENYEGVQGIQSGYSREKREENSKKVF